MCIVWIIEESLWHYLQKVANMFFRQLHLLRIANIFIFSSLFAKPMGGEILSGVARYRTDLGNQVQGKQSGNQPRPKKCGVFFF